MNYPSSNTARLKVLYTGPRGTHNLQLRFPAGHSAVAAVGTARDICTALSLVLWHGTQFNGAQWAVQGSNVFNPQGWGEPITAPTDNPSPTNGDSYGFYCRFEGRDATGARLNLCLFNGYEPGLETANNRVTPAESGGIGTILSALALAVSSGSLVSIASESPIFKPYGNTGVNKHIMRVSRRTIA